MPVQLIQSSFQFGEISELLHAQVSTTQYYRAARRIRNMIVIPQGGVKKRFGTKYVATIAGITDYRLIKTFLMDYEDGSRYYMVFSNLSLGIYFNNALVATYATTYTAAEVKDLSITQTNNLVFIAHGNHKPGILRRTVAHATWVLEPNPTFTFYPTYDFDHNYDAVNFQITEGGPPGVVITAAFNKIGQEINVLSSPGIFTANHVGGLYFGAGGTVRVTVFVNASTMYGRILVPFSADASFFDTSKIQVIKGSDSVLTEPAFSAARGWPQIVSFYQNRIFFARTSSLLGGIWGSNYNGFKSDTMVFDDSEILDTNCISTVLYSNKSVVIEHIVSYKTMIVMTSSGLYSTPLLADQPLVPTNIAFLNQQTSDSSMSVEPVIFDNEVIFFDKGGKKVKNISLTNNSTKYQTNNISVLASHLVDQPYSAAVYENSSELDGNWLMMVNSGTELPGSLAIYQYVPEQEITAWSLSTTDGLFRCVDADEDTLYFVVERVISGVTYLYIEQLDFTLNTDCAFTATYGGLTTIITGLAHLEGKTVRVIGDGAVMQSRVVVSGQIILEYGVLHVEVGLNYIPLLRPMPLNIPTQFGPNIYLPKSIKRVYVDFYKSAGITLNGELIPPFRFNLDQLNQPVILKTDFTAVLPMNGWDPRQTIDISQNDPIPMTIIGIGFEVAT